MNRATRDKFASGTNQADLTSGNACWETPPLIFAQLNADFGPFDLDLTADAGRALCPKWFGPCSELATDAIEACWSLYGFNGYSNPPYGPFVQKLLRKARDGSDCGFSATLLLPMRVTAAFKEFVLRSAHRTNASDLLFCDTRITFFENGLPRLNEKNFVEHGRAVGDPAMFDSIIVRYTPHAVRLNVDTWKVPKHVTADDLAGAFTRRSAHLPIIAQSIPDHVKTTRGGLLIGVEGPDGTV